MKNFYKNIMTFGKKVRNIIKKESDSKSVHNEKYLKTKTKSYNEKSTQIFTITKYQKKALYVLFHQ